MKTRIISGAVMIAIVVGVLILGNYFSPVLIAFMAFLSAMACYEMMWNTGIVKNKAAVCLAVVYSVLVSFSYSGITQKLYTGFNPVFLNVLYVVAIAFVALRYHQSFGLPAISAALAMPILLNYAFSAIASLYLRENGLFYLLLLLNFSSICDCGAYFTGVAIGKHKLCPEISPKKTVEGAVGGIVWSIIVSLILCFTMVDGKGFIALLISTVVFCVIGMCGDLFASVIKRSVGIKDYGKLIPGHGGILDRFDSILLIAPVLLVCVSGGLF